jgi:hypothetical protein
VRRGGPVLQADSPVCAPSGRAAASCFAGAQGAQLSVKKRQRGGRQSADSQGDAARLERTLGPLEFLERTEGALPEEISERDLETLNTALRFFFTDLHYAFELYREREGHGRAGAVKALGATWRFIAIFAQPLSDNLHVPILRLLDAPLALDDNHVEPMLRPVPHRGRAKSTQARAALKGQVAGTVMRLMQAGVPQLEACDQVAKALATHGIRPERSGQPTTATTVRHWCDDVEADIGRQGTAAMVFQDMFVEEERKRFAALPSCEAQRALALKSLAGFLGAAFPQVGSPVQKKPS